MAPFNFKSESHFVTSSDGTALQVYELNQPAGCHPSSIHKIHFTEVAKIPRDGTGLSFPNGAGKIKGKELTRLARHLAHLRLLVNPTGHCLQDVTQLRMYTDFNIYYLRLNDLFTWSHYGMKSTRPAAGWSRSELNHKAPQGMEALELTRYVMIRTDVYEAKEEEIRERKKANEEQKTRLEEMKSDFETRWGEKNDEVNKLRELLEADGEKNSYKAVAARSAKKRNLLKELDKDICYVWQQENFIGIWSFSNPDWNPVIPMFGSWNFESELISDRNRESLSHVNPISNGGRD
ncbi:hypothetical protein LINGRAHAP2_LOCUS8147 [Linum grandiflorum]